MVSIFDAKRLHKEIRVQENASGCLCSTDISNSIEVWLKRLVKILPTDPDNFHVLSNKFHLHVRELELAQYSTQRKSMCARTLTG